MADDDALTKTPETYPCRRPYCATPFNTKVEREVHEHKPTDLHLKHGMDFLCDWEGHANAIDEAGFCPVCQ